jgi:hypothetical protein
VGRVAPVSALKTVVLPELGNPTIPICMAASRQTWQREAFKTCQV